MRCRYTTELWCPWRDSNSRRPGSKPGALIPLSYRGILVDQLGLEPRTPACKAGAFPVTPQAHDHNEYMDCKSAGAPGQTRTGVTCLLRFGRGGEIRTPDHLVPGQVTYRWATPRRCGYLSLSLTGRTTAVHRRPPKPCCGRVAAVGYSVLFPATAPATGFPSGG